MITLTSFKRYHADTALYDAGYSIAVYQPHWFPLLPTMTMFDIRNYDTGDWVRPRDFQLDPPTRESSPALLKAYHDTLHAMFRWRWFLNDYERQLLQENRNIALCCWCPYDKAAQRQLRDYGSFVCHSWPVETLLRNEQLEVVRDADRERMVRV